MSGSTPVSQIFTYAIMEAMKAYGPVEVVPRYVGPARTEIGPCVGLASSPTEAVRILRESGVRLKFKGGHVELLDGTQSGTGRYRVVVTVRGK